MMKFTAFLALAVLPVAMLAAFLAPMLGAVVAHLSTLAQ